LRTETAGQVQDSLTPQGCMITVASKELEPETDAEERWYSTKYAAAPVSSPPARPD
jgi:hypothetical protein